MDQFIFDFWQKHHIPFVDQTLVDITYLGTYAILILLVIFIIGLLIIIKEYQKAAIMIMVITIAVFVLEVLKIVVGRPRPPVHDPLIPIPTDYSFPSGHSMMTMTIYLICAQSIRFEKTNKLCRKFIFIYAILMSILVGFSRIYIGIHYFSDVLIGCLLGVIMSIIYYFILKNNNHS